MMDFSRMRVYFCLNEEVNLGSGYLYYFIYKLYKYKYFKFKYFKYYIKIICIYIYFF